MDEDSQPQDADDLIREAAASGRGLTEAELERVIRHVAAVGFDPLALEAARGPLRGQVWNGQPILGSTRIPADVRHWLLHVVVNREWPDGTSLSEYVDSLRAVILDPDTGVFINEYTGQLGLGFIRESRDLRGPANYGWIFVQYRVSRRHWTTGFQPRDGLGEIAGPDWGRIVWLRRPTIGSGLS